MRKKKKKKKNWDPFHHVSGARWPDVKIQIACTKLKSKFIE